MIIGLFSHRPVASPVADRGQLLYHYGPAGLGMLPPLATEAVVTVDESSDTNFGQLLENEFDRATALFDELLSKEFRLDASGRVRFRQIVDELCARCSLYLRVFLGDRLEPPSNPGSPKPLLAARQRFSGDLAEFRHGICLFVDTAPEKCQLGMTYSADRESIGRKLDDLLASGNELIMIFCRYETERKER